MYLDWGGTWGRGGVGVEYTPAHSDYRAMSIMGNNNPPQYMCVMIY